MAIVQNPITGRSTGTFGGAVFATQFGKNVLRSKPVSVSVSQSDASKLARQKFKALSQAVNEFLPALTVFFTSTQFGMPISSYIFKQCYEEVLSGTLDDVKVDYTKIIPAPDPLGLGKHISAEIVSDELIVTLDQPAVKNIIGEDNKLTIAACNVEHGKLLAVLQDQDADLATKTFKSPLVLESDSFYIYVKPKKKVQFNPNSIACVVAG